MEANAFLQLVAEMRAAQREYFTCRSYASLQKSKALEKELMNQFQ